MKNFIKNLLVLLQLFSLFLASILFFILKISFYFPIYKSFYLKNNLAHKLGVSNEQLLNYTENLFAYLKNNTSLDRSWFTNKDILHMVDVRNLYLISSKIMYLLFFIFIILTISNIFIFKKNYLKIISKLFNRLLAIFMLLIFSLALYISINFTKFWISFHEILFSNDLWLLDPAESNLIKMFPENFFFFLVASIIISLIIYFVLLIILKKILSKKYANKL
ncbi:TIGR01906 family membrane protein [Gemella sp. zg-1178]|uniref:TIGR01906 family membrane protein n=1 Tax=Gemella sp. zg-1178 TaxID=2840372 RepID=UPI001C0580C8|nr:TIGR01906 family membrane protein [Gemella sp. zg-1178]MBU0279402.1 TIGR01906 family membrane protein [Gemella sp. zg-1178]